MRLIIISEQKSFIKKRSKAYETIIGEENSFLESNNVEIRYKNIFISYLNRLLLKLNLKSISDFTIYKKTDKEDDYFYYTSMGINYLYENKDMLLDIRKHNRKLILHVEDLWEPLYEEHLMLFNEIKPDYIFNSYKKPCEFFNKYFKHFYYLPTSVDLKTFKPLNVKKTRLFMQMGRVNEEVHKKILEYLKKHIIENNEENYVYRKNKNELIFKDTNELVKEINKTKYFVCVPKCLENFKRTGNVSDITNRYLEGIACKTLVIGRKPETFDEVLKESTMIDFNDDYSNFGELIDEYENNDKKYYDTLEQNYNDLINNNTWLNRLNYIFDKIKEG